MNETTNPTNPTNIDGAHCQSCGTTDPEYVGIDATTESEGYSLCCNEIVIINFGRDVFNRPLRCNTDTCYHA
jgi:hypothetical protein